MYSISMLLLHIQQAVHCTPASSVCILVSPRSFLLFLIVLMRLEHLLPDAVLLVGSWLLCGGGDSVWVHSLHGTKCRACRRRQTLGLTCMYLSLYPGCRLDYSGIALLIMGSFVPWLYYSFYCSPQPRLIYLSIVCVLGISAIIVAQWDRFATPKHRQTRAGRSAPCSSCVPNPRKEPRSVLGRHFVKKLLCCAGGSMLEQGSRVLQRAPSTCSIYSPGAPCCSVAGRPPASSHCAGDLHPPLSRASLSSSWHSARLRFGAGRRCLEIAL